MRSHPTANVLPDMPHNVGRIVSRSVSEYKQKKTDSCDFPASIFSGHPVFKVPDARLRYGPNRAGAISARRGEQCACFGSWGEGAGRSIVDQFSDGGQQIGVALDPNAMLLNPLKCVLFGVDDGQPRLRISFYG